MARPDAGPAPVTSAVARRDAPVATNYEQLIHAFDREDRKAELLAWLGSEENVQRFLAVAFHALATNSQKLARASIPSLIQAIKDSASLGLEPTGLTGEGYILPFGDQAVFIPGWRGYIKRIRNSGVVQDLDCQLVYMNDDFKVEFGTDPTIHHVPKLVGELGPDGQPLATRGEYRGAYAVAWMPSGRAMIEWMTVADINHDAKAFSPSVKAGRASPWDTHPGEMMRKTVIRRLAKRLPQSAVDRLLELDAQADQIESDATVSNGKAIPNVVHARAAVLAAAAGRRQIGAPRQAERQPEQPEQEPEGTAGPPDDGLPEEPPDLDF